LTAAAAFIAALGAVAGVFLLVRTLKSGCAIALGGPYFRNSHPLMY